MRISAKVQRAFEAAAAALEGLEQYFGPNYKLTLLARYTKGDLADADMVVTNDDLGDVAVAVERRRLAETGEASP